MLLPYRQLLLVSCITQLLSSCMIPMEVFIRNVGSNAVTLRVELFDKSSMRTLPNQVRAASKMLPIKSSKLRRLDQTLQVTWKDTSHFELVIPPQTTVDLSAMAGTFQYGMPTNDCRVILDDGVFHDTLVDRPRQLRSEKFGHKGIWFLKSAYWYDTEVLATPEFGKTRR